MKIFGALFGLAALLSFGGCVSPDAATALDRNITVFTIRQADASRGPRQPPRNLFTSRELVVAIIQNTTSREQIMLVEFLQTDTGVTIYKTGITVHSNSGYCTGPRATFRWVATPSKSPATASTPHCKTSRWSVIRP